MHETVYKLTTEKWLKKLEHIKKIKKKLKEMKAAEEKEANFCGNIIKNEVKPTIEYDN